MANTMYFRKHPLAFAVLLALGSQPGLAQTSPAAKALLQQGQYWQAQGQPARAAEAWKKLLRLQPDEPRALYGLAQGELAQKRSAGAAEILVRLRALDPQGRWATQLAQDITLGSGDAPKALDQARLLHESGDIEKSVEQYQRALGGSEPVGDVGLEYYRVFSKLPTGWKAARAGFERLAKDNPNDPQIELHLAFHLARGEEPRWDTRIEGIQRLGRVSLVPSVSGFAIECWKMALSWPSTKPEMLALFDAYLKLHPDDSEVAELRAGAVKKLATLAKAGEPGQVQPQIAAGLKALGQGDLAQAEGQYLARLKTHAKDPDALGGLGLVRMQQNRWEESAALLTLATQQKNGQNWGKALQSTRYQLLIEQGTSAQREGDLAQARSLLQQAIKLDPRLDGAMLALAALQAQAGEVEAAERGYRQVLARKAEDPAALRGLAGLLAASDRHDEASRLIDGLKPAQVGGVDEMNRLRATLASGLAKAALRRGDTALAQATLERAMSQDRNNPWIRWELAELYTSQGRHSEARGLIDGLLASQPDNLVALHASASLAAGRGQWRSALETLDRIPAKDRNADIASLQRRSWLQHQSALATSLARQGRKPEALALLDQAEPLTTGNRDLLGVLAEAYVDAGAPNRGLGLLRDLLSRSNQPSAADTLQYAGLLLKTEQDVECAGVLQDLAARALSAGDRKRLDDLMYHHGLRQVDLLRERGDLAGGRALLGPLQLQRPVDPLGDAVLARLAMAAGDKRAGLETARSLAARHPDSVEIQLTAAQLAARFKDSELAAASLKTALGLAPDDAEVLARAARLYRDQGQSARAATLFERAIALQNAPAPGHQVDMAAAGEVAGDPAKLLDDRSGRAELQTAALLLPPTAPVDYWRSAPVKTTAALQQAATVPRAVAGGKSATLLAATSAAATEGGIPEQPAGPNLRNELDQIRQARSPEASAGLHGRQRSGVAGTSALRQTELPVELRLPLGEGKVKLQLTQVSLDAGSSATGATITQKASGVAVAVAYAAPGIEVDIGQTPKGFAHSNTVGGVKLDGALADDGSLRYRVNLSRRPVTDSLLSFAGVRDSVSGKSWGGVVASGARLDLSKDLGGYGFYGSAARHDLRGHEVAANGRSEFGLGSYFKLRSRADSQLSMGLDLNSLSYQKNLGEFDFGQGGYFSPQRYHALTVPLNWAQRSGPVSYLVQGALGFQKFSQDIAGAGAGGGGMAVEPVSSSGIAYKLAASAQYQFNPNWLVDASLRSDNNASGSYRQWAAGLTLRYSFHPITAPLALPISASTAPFGQ